MRLKFLSIPLIVASIHSAPSYGFEANYMNSCTLSEPAMNNYEPSKFASSNNLLRPTGRREIYCGEKILLKVKVIDQACVPISDAKIYIWQIGCDGKYPYKPLRKRIDKKMINLEAKSSFVGHGTATSDNLGNARFLTINPPGKKHNYINVRISHILYGDFQTKIHISRDMVKKVKDYHVVDARLTLPWQNIRKNY